MKTTRLKKIWYGMLYRCNDKKCSAYKNYGEKGIQVCDDWRDYNLFHVWAISNKYNDSLTIDRIDSSKDYEPDNCRFLSKSENTALSNIFNPRNVKSYIATNPNGEVFTFSNMTTFCKGHNLHANTMRAVARGEKRSYKKWKCEQITK